MTSTRTHELVFETHDRDQGQIVTYSYATTASGARIMSRHDGSDQSLHFYWTAGKGRRLTAAELARYRLIERN